jgi:hypothetical protein
MAAVFETVFDPAEIKQRVAASRSKLSAVAQDERERNAHLLRVLEGVEKTLVQNQRHISGLEENHDRAVEEFRRLRDLLHDRQTRPPRLLRRCFCPKSHAARAELIARLDDLISAMAEGGEEPDGDATNERAPAPTHKRRSLVLTVFTLALSLPAKALAAIFDSLGSLIAETLIARKANSGMPLHLVRRKKARRWAGGADVRVV